MADLSAIEDAVTEINSLLEEVDGRFTRLKKVKNVNQSKKADDIAFMKNRIDRAKKALKTMRVEIRELSKVEQKPHNDKAAQLEEKINQQLTDIEWYEKDEPGAADANGIMLGSTVISHQFNLFVGPELDHNAIIDKAKNIQTQDIDILHRVTQQVQSTKDIGTDTLVKLNQQTEQMVQIDKGLDEVSSNLKLASLHLKTFVRRFVL